MPTKKELLNNATSMATVVGIAGVFFVTAGIFGKEDEECFPVSLRIMLYSFGGVFLSFSSFVGFCAVFLKITPIEFRSLLND